MTALRREIGPWGSAFLSFNGIVGAGIFALPGTLHVQFGGFAPWLFPLFAILVLAIALPFARLAASVSGTGGPVAYAAPLGPVASFQVGWLYYVARVAALAANANVFALYAATLWPPLGTAIGRAMLIVALVGALTWLNVAGLKRAIRALDLLTLMKALPLIGLALGALALHADTLPPPGPPPTLGAVEAAALLILYAFVGFENSLVPAGETRDPRRTIPRALLATIGGTALLYFLVQLGYAATMPEGLKSETPLVDLGRAIGGPALGFVLVAAALASIGGNVAASLTSTPRVTWAMAEGGLLPRWFAHLSLRSATPSRSALFMGALGLVLALTGSFVWLAIVSTLARLCVYALSIAATPRGGWGASMLVGAALIVCLWAAAQSTGAAWAMLAGLVVAGFALYAFRPTRATPRPSR